MKKRACFIAMFLVLLLCIPGCGSPKEGQQGQPDGPTAGSGETGDGEDNSDTDNPKENDMEAYESQVKVMSYNVYYQDVVEERVAKIWDLVIKNDPDVLMLQEVSIDWIPYVQAFMAENGYS